MAKERAVTDGLTLELSNWTLGSRPTEGLLRGIRRLTIAVCCGRHRMPLDDAEDVAQEVQIRVFDRLPQLLDAAAFPAWLHCLISRVIADLWRSQQRTAHADLDPWVEVAQAPGTEAELAARRLEADLDAALARIPTVYRAPLVLHLQSEMAQDEISRALDRPRGTVSCQLSRGLVRLQEAMEPGWNSSPVGPAARRERH